MSETPTTKLVKPHQLGWLRRSDLDPYKGCQVWEKPNGDLYGHTGVTPLLIQIPDRRRTKENG